MLCLDQDAQRFRAPAQQAEGNSVFEAPSDRWRRGGLHPQHHSAWPAPGNDGGNLPTRQTVMPAMHNGYSIRA
jgi:hypothetical protein